MAILDELKQLLIEHLDITDETLIVPKASFTDDLGADSLDLVELIMAIEEKFGIEVSDEDAEKLVTVQDALDYLKGRRVN